MGLWPSRRMMVVGEQSRVKEQDSAPQSGSHVTDRAYSITTLRVGQNLYSSTTTAIAVIAHAVPGYKLIHLSGPY